MISDWTIYGYVGESEVLCPACFRDDDTFGTCDYCNGRTWLAGFHDDPGLDSNPETGNHRACELDNRPMTRDVTAAGTVDGVEWHGLLSIEDTSSEGLSCGACGAVVFEADPSFIHDEYGHDEHVEGCELCRIIATQVDEWADEHEAREHRGAPILQPVTVRDGWQQTETRGGCPDCEREHAPADGQLKLEVER